MSDRIDTDRVRRRWSGGRSTSLLALCDEIDALRRQVEVERTANRITENHNHFDCAAAMAKKDAEVDALRAREVADGHVRIAGKLCVVRANRSGSGVYDLIYVEES